MSFMQEIKQNADFNLPGGVKVRLLREEPFKFFSRIEKWMADLKIGEPLAFQMSTDVNGWINFAVAYREYKEAPVAGLDPVLVLLDVAALLKDTVEQLHELSKVTQLLSRTSSHPTSHTPAGYKQEALGAD